MKNRHVVIPEGFESFFLEDVNTDFCCEGLENNDKELVLISAPAEFDINALKGEKFIPNGSKLLHVDRDENEDSLLKWELHASPACSDKHLKVLLPSGVHQKHVLTTDLSLSMNIIRNLQLPKLKSPKKKKKGTRLPKPIGLRARWKPFGSSEPDCADESRISNEHCNGFENNDDNEMHNSDVLLNGVKMEIDFDDNVNIDGLDNGLNHVTEGQTTDKEEDLLQSLTEVNNVADNVGNDNKKQKKKKKKKLDEYNVMEASQEPEMCASNEIKTVSVKTENEDSGENVNTPKKNRKRKRKSMLPEQETAAAIDKRPESDNFQDDNNLKQKKKKKKHKENDEKKIDEEPPSNPSYESTNDSGYTHKKKKKKKREFEVCNNENGCDKTSFTLLQNSSANSFINDSLQVKTEISNDEPLLNVSQLKKHKKKKKNPLNCQNANNIDEKSNLNNVTEKLDIHVNFNNKEVKIENENKDYLICGEEVPKKQKKKKKEKSVKLFYEDREGEKTFTSIFDKTKCNGKDTSIVDTGKYVIEQSLNGDEVHKKRRKKKKKSILYECGDTDTNNTVETDIKLKSMNGDPALLDSSKKKKPKKHKHMTDLLDGNSTQKRKNVTDSSENTSMIIPTCDMDSDLDSESEAKIFGVAKKRRFSN